MIDDPIPGPGHNNPPLPEMISEARESLPEQVTDYLRLSYSDRIKHANDLLARAREIPAEIEDDGTMGIAAKIIKEMRDLARALDTARETEKAPYFRAGQSADNFFFGIVDKIARRAKANKPGAADVLQQRVDDWNQKKLAREREERRQAEEKARKEAIAAAERQRLLDQQAEEARLAAERARKPDTQAAKEAVAGLAATNAAAAAAEAQIAAEKAQEARIDTLAKPADIVRHRVDDGPTVTMATEAFAIVADEALLDKEKLWPFIKLDAKEQALRAWAKSTNHNQQMAGAEIGRKPKTVVR